MEFRDLTDRPETKSGDSLDRQALDRKLWQAEDARPGKFRYYDMELGGEVHTSVAQEGGLYSIAKAEVFRPDGSSDVVGTVRYTVAGSETILYGDTLVTPNYGTEAALLQEVSWQAQSKGAHRLRVWIPDGSPYAEKRWLRHGFLPTERDPGARGVHWQRRI